MFTDSGKNAKGELDWEIGAYSCYAGEGKKDSFGYAKLIFEMYDENRICIGCK